MSMTSGSAVRPLVDVLLLAGGVGLRLPMVLRFAVMGQVGDLAVEAASGRIKPANRNSSVVA